MRDRFFKYYRIFSGVLIMFMITVSLNAQDVTGKKSKPAGTKETEEQGTVSEANNNADNRVENKELQEREQNNRQGSQKEIKEVKSSKPDMRKARGARPPYISRPAGNVRPQGAGKPSGAVKPGRR